MPATVGELSRCPLLAELPGERLAELARRMRREDVPAGGAPELPGTPGGRFYVVLSGVLATQDPGLGRRRILRPGDYFGGVAGGSGAPRAASVRALTPSVLASCDAQTFEALLRPFLPDSPRH